MFSNVAYEAFYTFLGLKFHERFIQAITSEAFFKGLVLLIFGVLFVMTILKFFSRYMPGSLVDRRHVPVTGFIKVIFFLFLGLSLLRVDSATTVQNFNRQTWHGNPYIMNKVGDLRGQYQVSFIFDLLSRSAEEISALLGRIVDKVLSKTHSQLDAPDFFYKAVMYAGVSTIEDENLKELVNFYTNECFEKVLPMIQSVDRQNFIEKAFFANSTQGAINQKLNEIVVSGSGSQAETCLDVKEDVRDRLMSLAHTKSSVWNHVKTVMNSDVFGFFDGENFDNLIASNMLVNHYLDEKEGFAGVMQGSQVPGAVSWFTQYLNRLTTVDGALSLIGLGDKHGSMEAAERSKQFSEMLARAPHIAGAIKMVLIMIFPWLMFLVVAGRWKVLVIWYAVYCSVLLWTPLWTLTYHIMLNISLSGEVMESFGRISDGVSLLGGRVITSRIYYMYSVFTYIQIMIGMLVTGGTLFALRPLLHETQSEHQPEFLRDGEQALAAGSKVIGV